MLPLALLLASCEGVTPDLSPPSALDARGPAAASIEGLWWLLFALGTVIYLVVMAGMLYALFRRRRREEETPDETGTRRTVLWGGLVLPAIILVIVFGANLVTLRAVARPEASEDLVIQVTGRRWWWEVSYQDGSVRLANEIHIPVGRPVQLMLTSDEVIHSFWVPQLHGKMDTNPGRVNPFWIQADEPGVYWGECAEFCGVQHAKMRFVVVAESEEEFAGWLEAEAQPAAAQESGLAGRGQEIFLSAGCMNCHTVRGTQATGELGPDLTHFASRLTLGAGAAANTPGALGGWIADPHGLKPGNLMPPSPLSGEELSALLAYMETLE